MTVSLIPVRGLPEITAGVSLADLITAATRLEDGDIVVVTSKVVSKAMGLTVTTTDRQQLVLEQSRAVVAERATATGVTRIVEGLAGPVMTGAGIDASNTDELLLLPPDPDAAAADLRTSLKARSGADVGVLLSDTSGRPWRAGLTDFALGAAGVQVLDDLRGLADTHGRDLAVTVRNLADALAAAADLVKGKTDRVPVAIIRGLAHLVDTSAAGARSLIRTGQQDWFSLGQREAVREALGIRAGGPDSEQVGLAPVSAEQLEATIARAVRAACHSTGTAPSAVSVDGARVVVPSGDGYLLARLEVALRGERLSISTRREADRAVITVTD